MRAARMQQHVTIELTNTGWLDDDSTPTPPCLRLHLSMPEEVLTDRFRSADGSTYRPGDLEFYFRERSSTRASVSTGVLTVSDRLTGDLVAEGAVSPTVVEHLVYAVRQYASHPSTTPTYMVELVVDDDEVAEFEKQTMLVYDSEGDLLRERSLIPAHIEI